MHFSHPLFLDEVIRLEKRAVAQAKAWMMTLRRSVETLTIKELDPETGKHAWNEMLHAMQSIYHKIDKGSQSSSASIDWYGRKKGERRTDPLLRYLHSARNADEHGIEIVLDEATTGFQIQAESISMTNVAIDSKGRMSAGNIVTSGAQKPVVNRLFRLELRSVKNLQGQSIDPPLIHRGQALVDPPSTKQVAQIVLDYMGKLVAEAEALSR